jgi:PIN domain nuclease of toxin-antitoxin system
VTILLDTHVWIWMTMAPERLSKHARRHIQKEKNELLLSAASAWEISIKWTLGKLTLPGTPAEFVSQHLAITKTYPLAIQHSHALRVAQLPRHHDDPFDRLLIAQAETEGVPILSGDPQFRGYAVDIIPA